MPCLCVCLNICMYTYIPTHLRLLLVVCCLLSDAFCLLFCLYLKLYNTTCYCMPVCYLLPAACLFPCCLPTNWRLLKSIVCCILLLFCFSSDAECWLISNCLILPLAVYWLPMIAFPLYAWSQLLLLVDTSSLLLPRPLPSCWLLLVDLCLLTSTTFCLVQAACSSA